MRIERIWRFLRSYNERKRKSCQAADVDQKRVKSTKERIVNIPVMVRQWFPHTDERHERHDGEVIDSQILTLKFESETAENKKKMKHLCNKKRYQSTLYISAKYKMKTREREHKRRSKTRGERDLNVT